MKNKDINDLLYILNKRIGFTEHEYNTILLISKKYNFPWLGYDPEESNTIGNRRKQELERNK